MTIHAGQPGVTLVVGATGLVGGAVVRLLRQRGVSVRALVRDDSNSVRDLRELGCETVRGDLKDAATVAASCRGVSTVVVTANSMLSRRAGDSIEAVDRRGVLRLIGHRRPARRATRRTGTAVRVTGRPVTVQRVPLAVFSTVATVLMPFNPTLGSLLRMIRAGDRPYVADMALLLAESGLQLTTFEAYVRRALAAGR